MKKVFLVLIVFSFTANAQHKIDVAEQMRLAAKQYKGMLQDFEDTNLFPQSVNKDGSYRKMKADWWCTGFFAGILWYLYDYTGDTGLRIAADKWTMALQKEQYNRSTHDLGFMLYCSFGNGYRITKDPKYKPILLQGAASLATRFHPNVGLIKSWESFGKYRYPVIIDNMMNLEYLLWAAKASGNKNYFNIAVSHADKTMQNHFRPDYSSFHVVCYDSVGNVIAKKTAQGYSDSSAWARGQAWGLYGYTMMYRETGDKRYLDQAIHIADFFMNHPNLPADKIPYWDFNAPNIPNEVRDASAAAIAASALFELSRYVNRPLKKKYFVFGEDVLRSLSGPEYFASEDNHHFLLKHSTGSRRANSEVDSPIIYADYYYLEALLRYSRLTMGTLRSTPHHSKRSIY